MKKINKKIKEQSPPEYISAAEYALLDTDERALWQPVPKEHERVPLFSKICLCISALCLVIYVMAIISESFADVFNRYVSGAFRFIFAKITNILPFSFAELILMIIVPVAIGYIVFAIRHRCDTWKSVISALSVPVSVVAIIFSCFVLNLGTAYRTPTLDKKLEIEQVDVTKENLYDTAVYLVESMNSLSEEIEYGSDRFSQMPYSFDEMNNKLIDAYDNFCDEYDFIYTFDSRLKPVLMSRAMSYMHTLGVYTFFTGEANINVDFPDYTTPYTAAHELAHQRGIAREDEANMMAFLVCERSDDAYIRYCAYLNMYEYVVSALYQTDPALYREVRDMLDAGPRAELSAMNKFFSHYSGSTASKVSSAVNDTFLKVQGTEGEISYNLVVELTVSYLTAEKIIG